MRASRALVAKNENHVTDQYDTVVVEIIVIYIAHATLSSSSERVQESVADFHMHGHWNDT